MSKPDKAHQWTDEELKALERRIARVYREARDELQDAIDAYFESFKVRDEQMKKLIGTIQNGKEWTEEDYRQWRLNSSAVRAARTAVTGAQNGGRMDSYKAASDMGIKVRKRWIATKDGRTRHSHQKLDGQTVDYDKPFVSDLGSEMMYPGDPHGAKPADLYNCRCTMRTVEKPGIEAEPRKMRVRDPKTGKNVLVNEMTYQEWERWVKSRGD